MLTTGAMIEATSDTVMVSVEGRSSRQTLALSSLEVVNPDAASSNVDECSANCSAESLHNVFSTTFITNNVRNKALLSFVLYALLN